MTTALRSDEATALSAPGDALQVSARMSVFLAEELLPLMAGLWPASANQLDSNARGVALAWGSMLKGFSAQQIRKAVLQLGEDADRQFAPRPAEVRAEILRRLPPDARTKPHQLQFSIAACEMEATVIVLKRDGEITRDAVKIEMERILTDRRQRGYTITGKF
ncbi:hypothetical protein [Aeromonas hydrophila]|uniref:hypothetical protein n=1 Tax=Aeromonas hydrophila TaxID=644 RepID=UPI002B4BBADA|nr:hypothetical protein [Aeromonas hydrophila]WRK93451.1 hypothetical protein U8518_07210 [Aeromonas hydrophila]